MKPSALRHSFLVLLAMTTATVRADAPEHGHDEHGHHEHDDEVKLLPEAVKANGIRIETAAVRSLAATITAPARLVYDGEAVAHVGAIAAGRVKSLRARVGDIVSAGDVLAVIDSAEFGQAQSEFLQRRTSAEAAKPSLELAQSAYDRAKKLFDDSQSITLTEVQSRLRELRSVQAEVRNAEAAAVAARQRLGLLGMSVEAIEALAALGTIDATYAIHAPIAGRLIEREATLGELVGPDKERLMLIADLSQVWALVDVPETMLTQIAEGTAARLTLLALGDEPVEGRVSFVSPELDAATRTVRVRVVVPNAERRLRPGMFGRAELTTTAAGGAAVLAVPASAVHIVEGAPAVFVPVEGEPNTFAKRAITVGPAIGGYVPVLGGLNAGEPYVAAGGFILKAELGKAGAAHEH